MKRLLGGVGMAAMVGALTIVPVSVASAATGAIPGVNKIVVIYEENHSFDNLYGLWGDVNGQHVNGLGDATAAQKTQVGQDGAAFPCLLQNDVNLDTTNGSKYGTTP